MIPPTRGVFVHIELAYGTEGLGVDIPDDNLAGVLRMSDMPVIDNPGAELIRKLNDPAGASPVKD